MPPMKDTYTRICEAAGRICLDLRVVLEQRRIRSVGGMPVRKGQIARAIYLVLSHAAVIPNSDQDEKLLSLEAGFRQYVVRAPFSEKLRAQENKS
jgi:hypothetical protein